MASLFEKIFKHNYLIRSTLVSLLKLSVAVKAAIKNKHKNNKQTSLNPAVLEDNLTSCHKKCSNDNLSLEKPHSCSHFAGGTTLSEYIQSAFILEQPPPKCPTVSPSGKKSVTGMEGMEIKESDRLKNGWKEI